jgi:GNAT superfamily N-acetyltransferase
LVNLLTGFLYSKPLALFYQWQKYQGFKITTLKAKIEAPQNNSCHIMNPQKPNPNLLIRPATIEDCGLILSFIRELADYEKLLHEVVADIGALENTLFGDRPYAEAVIADYQDEAVGFALFFHNYSTFLGKPGLYLEDLYISPSMRGRGFGKSLLAHVASVAVARDCGRLEWSVLDWNQPAKDFYRSLGAQSMDDWTVNRLAGQALKDLADYN